LIIAGTNMLEIHDHIGCCLREQPGISVNMLHELTSIARPTPFLPKHPIYAYISGSMIMN
jgi:hypothetical protein